MRERPKVVVLSGAGLSAPSGVATFRDADGIWSRYRIEDVATPEAWARDPAGVLDFYNARRAQLATVRPNAGHHAITRLESHFDVVVVTQNIDDLHERAGSSAIIHLHGELTKVRSSADPDLVYPWGYRPLALGDHCARGSQLRPQVVWFGESVLRYDEAATQVASADSVIVVGTSLTVFPAAALVEHAPPAAARYHVDVSPEGAPAGYALLSGSAEEVLPALVDRLIAASP